MARQIYANQGGIFAACQEGKQEKVDAEWRKSDRQGGVESYEYSFLIEGGKFVKCLDNFEQIKNRMNQKNICSALLPYEQDAWAAMTEEIRDGRLRRICSVPFSDEDFTVMYSAYFRLKWLDALEKCVERNGPTILEVGSGSSVNIPNALTIFDPNAKYITANMNKILTEGLRLNTASLPISIRVIEDDANNIKNYLPPDSVDAIVFEHSVNDVLQAIICEQNGMDTTNSDWFEIISEMIQLICAEYENNNLEKVVKAPFLSLISNCMSVLKPGGFIIMQHYMFQYDLDLGYNPELWENMLPTVRPWLNDILTGKEVEMSTFDPQWWIFFQKQGV